MANYWSDTSFEKSLEFQPYQLPYQQVVNALQARTSYFIEGAQRIKNSYDSTFNFDLSNEQNISSLQADKDAADKKIKDIVKSDLSIGDFQNKALDVMKPIASNQNYLYDENLTKTIKSGLQQAQTSLKKDGAGHYNSLSVQAMQNTLNKWRTDDPGNIVSYLDDTLGTQYQPYDPKVKETFLKDLETRVKNGKVKVDQVDGQGRIISSEYHDLNSLEAQEYIKSLMPQQERTQNDLQARVDLDNLSELQQTPEGKAQIIGHYNALKKFNIDTQIGYLTIEKNKYEQAKAFLPDSDTDGKKTYDKAIASINEEIKNAPSKYQMFEDDAYVNPNKIKQARNQIASIYNDRTDNGLISGLGLNQTSTTIKQDAAYFSAQNLDLAQKKFQWQQYYQSQDLAIKARKAGLNPDGTPIAPVNAGTNPNEFNSNAVPNADLAVTEDQKAAVGAQIDVEIKGRPETVKDQSYKGILEGLDLKVRGTNGYSNVDLLTAVDEASAKGAIGGGLSLFNDIYSQFRDDRSKNLVKALMSEGAALENRKLDESKIGQAANLQAKRWLRAALSNPETFQKAISKAGLDGQTINGKSSLEFANDIYFQNQEAAALSESNVKKYLPTLKDAAKATGIPDFDNINDDKAFFYEGDNFIYARKDQFAKQGFTPKQIDALAAYTAGKKTKEQVLRENPEMGYIQNRAIDIAGNMVHDIVWNPQYGNTFDAMKGKWGDFQKNYHLGLEKLGSEFQNKKVTYDIFKENNTGDKNFNPNEDIKAKTLRDVLSVNVMNNVEGNTDNPKFYRALQTFIQNGGISNELIQGVSVENDGSKAWLTITPNSGALTDATKKRFAEVLGGGFFSGDESIDDFIKELGQQKINIPLGTAKDVFRISVLSPATKELKSGSVFGVPKLMSGRNIHIEDRGTHDNVQLYFTGSFLAPRVAAQAGKFQIKEIPFSSGNLQEIGDYSLIGSSDGRTTSPQQLLNAFQLAPNDASKHISYLDMLSTHIKDVLDKYKINSSSEIDWNSLPLQAKEELKKVAPTIFGGFK